jgi:exosortase family protein XrtM
MTLNTTLVRFAFLFAGLFALQFAAFEASRGSHFEKIVIDDLALTPTAALINWFAPAEAVRVDGRSLTTTNSVLRITRGCEGVEMLLLLTAGILAFPTSTRHRARGFCVGLVIVYALTIARLVLLHFTLRYSPRAWDMLHGLVLPLGPVLLIALYFLHWSAAGAQIAQRTGPLHGA